MSATYEVTQPWVCYSYLSTDPNHEEAFTSEIRAECCVCGVTEVLRVEVPAVRDQQSVPPGYRHPAREKFLAAHTHQPLPHALTWAKPLRNTAAHSEALDVLQVIANQTGATLVMLDRPTTPTPGASDA